MGGSFNKLPASPLSTHPPTHPFLFTCCNARASFSVKATCSSSVLTPSSCAARIEAREERRRAWACWEVGGWVSPMEEYRASSWAREESSLSKACCMARRQWWHAGASKGTWPRPYFSTVSARLRCSERPVWWEEEEEEEEEVGLVCRCMTAAASCWTWRKDMERSVIRATMTKEEEPGGGKLGGCCGLLLLLPWGGGHRVALEEERGGCGEEEEEKEWRRMGRSHCPQVRSSLSSIPLCCRDVWCVWR